LLLIAAHCCSLLLIAAQRTKNTSIIPYFLVLIAAHCCSLLLIAAMNTKAHEHGHKKNERYFHNARWCALAGAS
jgi:uncharacterized protein involved in response to NO